MFGSMDLQQVRQHQAELRREAAERRLARAIERRATRTDREPRRVLGLRLGLA